MKIFTLIFCTIRYLAFYPITEVTKTSFIIKDDELIIDKNKSKNQ